MIASDLMVFERSFVQFNKMTWRGNVIRSSYIVEQIGWYKSVATKPLYCSVFGLDENILLFDFNDNQLHRFKLHFHNISKMSF